jgi:iron complex outermembrane receptor protein
MIRTLAAALVTSTCIVALATPAAAQTREYNIPAGSLKSALDAYVRQSGRQVVYRADEVRSARSPGARGPLSAEAALANLLVGSGFTIRIDGNLIAIVKAGNATAAANRAAVLGEVTEVSDVAADTEIVVTGTHIRGVPVTAPVVSVTRAEIEERGFDNLGSFTRSIPQNFAGGQNPGVITNGAGDDVSGSSALNLRGLGPDATLTLLNGHRLAYDGVSQGVDISAIPLLAVDRIEIVADGSSAIYGSDAVGGVANIVLRRDFDGVEVLGRFGASTDGGNEQQQYGLIAGQRWQSGGIMVAGDYSRSTQISARQRSYTSQQNETLTLFPEQEQFSAVLSGHQGVGDALEFAVDAQYSYRDSRRDNPFTTASSVSVSGLRMNPRSTTYSVTPSLTWSLPGDWTIELSGTHGYNLADLNSRRYASSVETGVRLKYENTINSAEIGVEGPVFSLPGGDVRLAAGGGIRSTALDVFVQNRASSGVTTVTSDFRDSRDIYYAYAETVIPVFGEGNAQPLLQRLALTGAVRYEDYAGVDGVATPRFGLIYQPAQDLTLRASWGRSFKAPTLFQENEIREGTLLPGSYYLNNPSGLPVLYIGGGGTPLRPERATTWTVSGELRPSFLPGLSIEASYFNVRYEERVVAPVSGILSALANPDLAALIVLNPTAAQVLAEVEQLPTGLIDATGAFDPASVAAIIDGTLRNVARQTAEGVDIAASYRTDLGASQSLSLSATATYLESAQQLLPGQAYVDLAGTIFDPPHWRWSLGGTWERSNVSLSTFVNHVGGTVDNRLAPFVDVESFTSVDATARIRTTDQSGPFAGIELTLAVQNLFDERPALISNTDPSYAPYDSTNQPATGRVVSVGLRKRW